MGNREPFGSLLSDELVNILQGLLEIDPAHRLCFGETCYSNKMLKAASIWDMPWVMDEICVTV